MSSTDAGAANSTEMAEVSTIDMGLEVVTIPVSDVDRALRFYKSLGWRLDIDIDLGDFRQVQMTPPRSQCSIHFGKGITSMEPGSHEKLYLAVKDIDAAREDLLSRGIDVSEVEEQPKPPGFDLPGRSYFAYASFSDPDGNSWLLQEVTARLPGRVDAASTSFGSASDLASAMRRASVAHGEHEKLIGAADPDWPAWYAAYMVAEQAGTALPT
jgi:catechol 2,3-dioxygenase-like lactoylglutathione lyase family enzyme